MLRSILAVLLGLALSVLVVTLVEGLGHRIYPQPADLDFGDTEMMTAYIETLPLGAFLFVLAAWSLGTLVGGTAAGVIARRRPRRAVLFVGALMLAATAMNLFMIPHPGWFAVAGVALVVLMTFVAGRLAGALLARRMPA